MLLSIVNETTINYEQLDDITMSTRQNTTKQNIRDIIFVIISCYFLYAILPSLCLRQGRVLDKDESLPTTCLACFRDSHK